MRRKLRNMKEFSNVTGLSRPTVSKYFNDPTSVRATTRARIEAALEQYDYRPNFFAVNQNRRNPKTLGIVVPQFTDPFFAEMAGSIECAAIDAGYFAITLSSHGSPEDEARAIEMIRSLNIGGVILSPLGRDSDAEAIMRLQEEVPLLAVRQPYRGARCPVARLRQRARDQPDGRSSLRDRSGAVLCRHARDQLECARTPRGLCRRDGSPRPGTPCSAIAGSGMGAGTDRRRGRPGRPRRRRLPVVDGTLRQRPSRHRGALQPEQGRDRASAATKPCGSPATTIIPPPSSLARA